MTVLWLITSIMFLGMEIVIMWEKKHPSCPNIVSLEKHKDE